eukprot:TRINITY_DN17325_c0_g1_i1.p1 TRINITY_DN17325_c0_g1~~TRINITY_DN17325_c0_g1_i1.p1  ORF type:complete len:180 (-),score=32.64 TRINITY_DN17325_c0_g1_i1:162-701(-)
MSTATRTGTQQPHSSVQHGANDASRTQTNMGNDPVSLEHKQSEEARQRRTGRRAGVRGVFMKNKHPPLSHQLPDERKPLTMNLHGNIMTYENGYWQTEGGGGGGANRAQMERLREENNKLREQNRLLDFKNQLLIDMLTLSNLDVKNLERELKVSQHDAQKAQNKLASIKSSPKKKTKK